MKHFVRIILIISLLLALCTLSSCATKISFDDLEIIGNNVENIAEGNYTLRYNVQNLTEYNKKNDVDVRVSVIDSNNNETNVINNRIVHIKADETYLVTIVVSANEGKHIKSHNYSIVAVKNPIIITFTSHDYNNFDNITKSVPYGSTLKDIPEVPIYTPVKEPGYTITVTNSAWDKTYFTKLTKNITVHANYEIKKIRNTYTLYFDTKGGNDIESITADFGTTVSAPPPPTKNGAVFFSWYTDEEYTKKYIFPNTIGSEDSTVYAQWLLPINNATEDTYFKFTQYNDEYYTISAKDSSNMPQTLIIPNVYNGKPITKIDIAGFAYCTQIKDVTIPNTINEIGISAFSDKFSLENKVNKALQTVTFADDIQLLKISESAFSYNSNLLKVNIPSSVKYIEKDAFQYCTSLSDIIFAPQSKLEEIRDSAFYGCISLTSLDLPISLKKFSSGAFYECLALEEVVINSLYPPLLVDGEVFVFGYNDENGTPQRLDVTIYVLEELFDFYKSTNYKVYNLELLLKQEIIDSPPISNSIIYYFYLSHP